MNPNKSSLIKKMNQLMLEYADDIVPVERNRVVNFFKERNIPCRKDYIDFLARFGGNYSYFLKKYNFDCTFQEIKEIYLENAVYDPVPPDGYCIIGNQLIVDWFVIENSTGRIFNDYPTKDDPIIGKADFENIDIFLWWFLYGTYSDNFIANFSLHENIVNLDKYLTSNRIELIFYGTKYFIDEGKVYIYYENSHKLYIHILTDDFVKRLYE
ncbi:hypothetical protein [Psychrobacter sp. I-STPA6b]|uniref:hypothetical protein n=1 Tax=Psychrobacter sp. I-STPA6b TaxID=2585718 RepID=UPI001D0C7BE8|nr:hypothetical protein [Psychrobacter sp. I-STPA6b]